MPTDKHTSDQLATFALEALQDPQTYEEARPHKIQAWPAIEAAVASLTDLTEKPLVHAQWDVPLLTKVLVDWASMAPAEYAAFMAPLAPDVRCQSLATLPGMWHLSSVVRALADDHDYVLQATAQHFRLARSDSVRPWQPLVGPTELAHAVLVHRGLPIPPPSPVPPVATARRHSGR